MPVKAKLKNLVAAGARFILGLKRPSKAANLRRLRSRGEDPHSITIREATHDDLPKLAALHVKTWNETYNTNNGPSYQVRERQWKETFQLTDGSWFCFVAENKAGELVGFAKGKKYTEPDPPDVGGELNKIYILQEYQHLGIGRKLAERVAVRFLDMGINSMILFGMQQNPSCYFHEALGGKRLYADNGEFHGGYIWRDLRSFPFKQTVSPDPVIL